MDIEPERALSIVRRQKWGRHLLRHKRNSRVVDTSGAFYHLDAQGKYRVLQGLLPRLRATYWSHSTYYQMLKADRSTISRGITKKTKKKKPKRAATTPAQASVVDWLLACPEKGWFCPLPSESTDEI
jgi:hypothetical protein